MQKPDLAIDESTLYITYCRIKLGDCRWGEGGGSEIVGEKKCNGEVGMRQ